MKGNVTRNWILSTFDSGCGTQVFGPLYSAQEQYLEISVESSQMPIYSYCNVAILKFKNQHLIGLLFLDKAYFGLYLEPYKI